MPVNNHWKLKLSLGSGWEIDGQIQVWMPATNYADIDDRLVKRNEKTFKTPPSKKPFLSFLLPIFFFFFFFFFFFSLAVDFLGFDPKWFSAQFVYLFNLQIEAIITHTHTHTHIKKDKRKKKIMCDGKPAGNETVKEKRKKNERLRHRSMNSIVMIQSKVSKVQK